MSSRVHGVRETYHISLEEMPLDSSVMGRGLYIRKIEAPKDKISFNGSLK